MRPLRILFLVSVAVAAVVSLALGLAVREAGLAGSVGSAVIALLGFAALVGSWALLFFRISHRARELDDLTQRARTACEDPAVVTAWPHNGELDDLARSIDELGLCLSRQRGVDADRRATMDQIVDSLEEGLLAVSQKGRIVFANRRASEMLHVEGDLRGRSMLEVIRRQAVSKALDAALGGSVAVERISVGEDAAERQIEIRVSPIQSSSEIAAVALLIDLTTVERLQRIRKDFLDDFSHEVRTPLAGLRSAAETLQHGGLHREDESQLRLVILRQLARIERLVTDLSDLNQIESGRILLRRERISLRYVVQTVCEDMKERLDAAGVTVRLDGDDVTADADAGRVLQIVSNLVDNALKHGGGRGEILVEFSNAGCEAVMRVSDEGDGIPPHELDRIFHRFYRVDKSRGPSVAGTGLGLAIAKHLTLVHGGTIRAYNREGRGATFEVRLPSR